MSEELKPCPFCGAKASVQRYSSGTGGPKCAVWCDACHVGTSWLHGDDGEARVVAEWNRRAPVAARELDVEAEPLQTFEKWWATPTTSTAAPYTFMHEQSAHAAWLAARSAAQSTAPSNSPEFDGIAPVSTEQAGDAWIDLKQRKPGDWEQVLVALDNGTVTVGMRGSMGWHWEESDAPEDAEATATHWKPWPVAPSPNNSPVGGED